MQAERRKQLQHQVDHILGSAKDGTLAVTQESSGVDLKEEAGRRNQRGEIVAGEPHNTKASEHLADEVACFSNTPGGGVIIVGVEDGTGRIIGTELDVDWLRSKIFDAVQVAPDIQERVVNGLRVLVIFVAEAEEPVANRSGSLRWRVGEHCKPVDRAEWWQHRRSRAGFDVSATASSSRVSDIDRTTKRIIANAMPDGETQSLQQLLMTAGAIAANGEKRPQQLTQAAARAFTDQQRSFFEFTEITVPGGAAKRTVTTDEHKSAVEQLEEIVSLLRTVMQAPVSPAQMQVREEHAIPLPVFREALLNALVHMDWNRSEPISVQWFSVDSILVVRSPGGFPDGITASNVLSHRRARYPAFADLFRALGFIEKSGLGVDRMYAQMVALGLLPPQITELPGKYVECRLFGGKPVAPMVELISRVRPVERQSDVRVILILDYLLRHPWIGLAQVKSLLQYDDELSAQKALQAANGSAVSEGPLLSRYGDGWVLGERARELMRSLLAQDGPSDVGAAQFLSYRGSSLAVAREVAVFLLRQQPVMVTAELCDLTGMSRATAVKHLTALVDAGELVRVGQGRGTRFVLPGA